MKTIIIFISMVLYGCGFYNTPVLMPTSTWDCSCYTKLNTSYYTCANRPFYRELKGDCFGSNKQKIKKYNEKVRSDDDKDDDNIVLNVIVNQEQSQEQSQRQTSKDQPNVRTPANDGGKKETDLPPHPGSE